MSLSDLKREVKKRYLLALRESKYLISWAIFLLVIAALLEGLAPIYNYLGLKYYPWAVIAGYLSYLSITLWIIYLYHKRMRFSTPWGDIRTSLGNVAQFISEKIRRQRELGRSPAINSGGSN